MPLLLPSTDPQSPQEKTFFLSLHSVYYKHTRKNTSSLIPQQQGPAFSGTPLQVSLLLLSIVPPVLLPLSISKKRMNKVLFLQMFSKPSLRKQLAIQQSMKQLLDLSKTRQWPTREPHASAFLQLHPKENPSWF